MTASVWNPAGSSTNVANADNNYKHQTFTVDSIIASTGIFILTTFAYQTGTESLLVLVNGVDQILTADYTETNNTTVTIPGVKLGDIVVIRALVGSTASQSAAASAAAAAASAASIAGLNPPNLPVAIAIGGTGANNKSQAFLNLAPVPVIGQVIGSLDGVNYITIPALPNIVSNVTVSTTLTATTLGYIATNMAVKGSAITLPDATTVPATSAICCVIDNRNGGYSVGVRNTTGQLLLGILPGGIAYINLVNKASANGIWNISCEKSEPGLVTIDSVLSLTYVATPIVPFVAIDANTSIHFAVLSSGFAAFVVDNVAKTVTTPTTISVVASITIVAAFLVTANTAIVFFHVGGSTHYSVIITISGVSGSYTIAVGTAVNTSTDFGGGWAGEDSIGIPRILQLTPSLYLCVGCPAAGTSLNAQAFSVSGAVITVGTALNFATANTGMSLQKLVSVVLTGTTALIAYGRATPDTQFSSQVISVAGTTCTANAVVLDGQTFGNSGATIPSFCMLNSTKMLMNFFDGTNSIYLRTISVVGTVPAWGTALQITGSNYAVANSGYTANNATRLNTHLQTLSATTALMWFIDTSSISRIQVISENTGVLTLGTAIYSTISSSGSSVFSISPFSTTEFVGHINASNTGVPYSHQLVAHSITGTTVLVGQKIPFLEEASHLAPTGTPCTRLSSGDYCAQTTYGMAVYRCNGYSINIRGLITTSAINSGQIKTVVSSNRFVLLNTSAGTISPTNVAQLNITNMEIAI